MNMNFVSQILLCLVLLIVQALVLNNSHLFGFATPLLYVYTVICMRRNFPRWAALVISFLLGLGIDIFSNTPGVASASMTLLSAVRPALLALFVPRDSSPELVPSFSSLGTARFVYYTMMMVIIYCVVFFSLEMFTIFNVLYWAESILGSMALTVVLILVMENVRRGK